MLDPFDSMLLHDANDLFCCNTAASLSATFEGAMTKYPGTKSSSIYGVVAAYASADELMMGGTLYGLVANKQKASSAANSLGVHVHAGETCDDATKVMGHYFNGTKDPWTNIIYKSDGKGVANFKFSITKEALGTDPRSVAGRAFVVHNEDGSRAACAVLKLVKAVGMVEAYPGTTGPIEGTVSYTYKEEGVMVVGAVSGVEASKSAIAGVGNSMGVHIHSGFTCSNASLVGGHYFGAGQSDPWKTVVYNSTSSGTGFFKIMMSAADMGTTSMSTAGRAFVIHNDGGGRIGCVLLGAKQPVTAGVVLIQSSICESLSINRFDRFDVFYYFYVLVCLDACRQTRYWR